MLWGIWSIVDGMPLRGALSDWFLPFAAALAVVLGLWPFLDLLVVY